MTKFNPLCIGLMLLVCMGPLHNVLGKTAVEPFALRDVTLLGGPFKQAEEYVAAGLHIWSTGCY